MQIGFSISHRARVETPRTRHNLEYSARQSIQSIQPSYLTPSLSLTGEINTLGVQLQLVLMTFTKRRYELCDQCSAHNLWICCLGSLCVERMCSPHACLPVQDPRPWTGLRISTFSIPSLNPTAPVKGWLIWRKQISSKLFHYMRTNLINQSQSINHSWPLENRALCLNSSAVNVTTSVFMCCCDTKYQTIHLQIFSVSKRREINT